MYTYFSRIWTDLNRDQLLVLKISAHYFYNCIRTRETCERQTLDSRDVNLTLLLVRNRFVGI